MDLILGQKLKEKNNLLEKYFAYYQLHLASSSCP